MHAPHILHHLLTHACDWMHTARRKALAVSVLAAVTGRRLTVTALGRSIASKAQEKHCIKRADRLLSNRHCMQNACGCTRPWGVGVLAARRGPS